MVKSQTPYPARKQRFLSGMAFNLYEVVRVSWRHIVSLFVLGSVKGILLYRLPSKHIWSIEAGQ